MPGGFRKICGFQEDLVVLGKAGKAVWFQESLVVSGKSGVVAGKVVGWVFS